MTTFRLYNEGKGYRSITRELDALGVATSRGSVYRLLKRLPPYQDAGEKNEERV